jgi:hypothetical protein
MYKSFIFLLLSTAVLTKMCSYTDGSKTITFNCNSKVTINGDNITINKMTTETSNDTTQQESNILGRAGIVSLRMISLRDINNLNGEEETVKEFIISN